MSAPRTSERDIAWERAVEMIRRTSSELHESLLMALAFAKEDETMAILNASPDLLLRAQGRAQMAVELYERALDAYERLNRAEEAARQAEIHRRNQNKGTNRNV